MKKPTAILSAAMLCALGAGYVLSGEREFASGEVPLASPQECFVKENEYEEWLCLESYMKALVRENSVEYAMSELRGLKDEGLVENCQVCGSR
jgi:hypothetical protein